MTSSRRANRRGQAGTLFRWLALLLLPFVILASVCLVGVPRAWGDASIACQSSALDKTVRFDTDGKTQKIIFGFRNVADQPCSLRPVVRIGLWSIAEQRSTVAIPACSSCNASDAAAFAKSMSPFLLEPTQSVAFTIAWPVAADAEAASCRNVDDIFLNTDASNTESFVQIIVGGTALRLCDPVSSGPYRALDSEHGDPPRTVPLRLASNTPEYYPDEPIEIHLAADDPAHLLRAALTSCQSLLLMQRIRVPTGEMRIRITDLTSAPSRWQDGYVTMLNSDESSKIYSDPAVAAKFPDEMDYQAGSGWRAEGRSSSVEHDAAYISICDHHWQTIATSNVVQLHAATGAPQKPEWGPQSSGFALSVTVDRDTYKLGQDVPLHIACIRNGQDWTVEKVHYNPACAPDIQVVDSSGAPVARGLGRQQFRGGPMSDRHVAAGEIVPGGTTLRDAGLLPQAPGTYRVTATWYVPVGNLEPNPERVVVRSLPVTIEVADRP